MQGLVETRAGQGFEGQGRAVNESRQTAFNALEREHYQVAGAALALAQAVEMFLNTAEKFQGAGTAETVNLNWVRMTAALVRFREAASRVV